MKNSIFIAVCCVFLFYGQVEAQENLIHPMVRLNSSENAYILEPGDLLSVEEWGVERLVPKNYINENIRIRPDGKVSIPLAGELVAGGKTIAALTDEIDRAMGSALHNETIDINVLEFHTTRVYVLGEITRPGMYDIGKDHTLLDAIGTAGGDTRDTAKKKVFIIRRNQPGSLIKVNYNDILKKGDLSQNYVLSDGDIVYLTNSGRIDLARDILPAISSLYYLDIIKTST